ncbi:MAG: copper ion binding protein [Acidimicrobiia bacterium]|jgi:copper ion binding protein
MASRTTFSVRGMTCDHCVRAVETEVTAIPGVSGATADLATGHLVVRSETPVDPAAVREAVAEAGYEVAA